METRTRNSLPTPRALRRASLRPLFFLVFCLGVAAQTPEAGTSTRFALVVGNGKYAGLASLANPVNDATDVAAALGRLGFTVDLLTDAELPQMEEAIVRLGSRLSLSRDSTGFFFFAGHGVQSAGVNYLIPSNTTISSETFLRSKALSLQAVLDTMNAGGNKLNVIVLDACRDSPFGWARGGSRGLNVVSQQPAGSIVAFATSAGSVAQDGMGRNGVFTSELLRHIGTKGIDVAELFRRTGAAVRQVTNGHQVPAVYSQFFGLATLGGEDPQTAAGSSPSLSSVDPSGAKVVYRHPYTGNRQRVLQDMISQFNASNPYGVTVSEEYAGAYSDIYTKVIAAIAAKTLPGLVAAYQNQAAGYQESDALVNMDVYVHDPRWGLTSGEQADFFEGMLLQDRYSKLGGIRLGFPTSRSAEVLYYNKTWLKALGFSAPPTTWDDFYATVKAARDPARDRWGYSVRTDASNVFSQVVSRGGSILAPGGQAYRFSSPELQASMELFQRMYREGIVKKIAAPYADQTDFGNYRVLFTMGSTAGLSYYESAVQQGKEGPFDWSVAAIPFTLARPVVNVYGASVSIPRTTPAQQLGAWLFAKWLAEPAQQRRWLDTQDNLPARRSVGAHMGDYLERNPRFRDAWDLLTAGTTTAEPSFTGYAEVRDCVSRAFDRVLDGADVAKTLAELEVEAAGINDRAYP